MTSKIKLSWEICQKNYQQDKERLMLELINATFMLILIEVIFLIFQDYEWRCS